MQSENNKNYDVAILGGGITGASLLYVLSKYTNIKSMALLEKNPRLGLVNTCSVSNAQTLHFGDIETNYSLEKAKSVKEAAEMVVKYLEQNRDKYGKVFIKSHKMVLGVGAREVEILEKRFEEFKKLYPKLKKIYAREEISKLEPEITKERNPNEKILALTTEDGYVVDYGLLADSFVEDALQEKTKKIKLYLSTAVKDIEENNGKYEITTTAGKLSADVVAVALGSYSLLFAKSFGYGKEYLILPVAGNFYSSSRKILNGKVYTIQKEKLPFAAVHGDPNIHNLDETRFGPTAKVIPILERRNWRSFWDFLKSAGIDFRAIASLIKILSDADIIKFIAMNFIYDLPLIGSRSFLKTAQKIVPSLKISDIKFGKGLGGIRPQIVDKNSKKLLMGDAEIIGRNILFNITPSPGATACLRNAEKDTKRIIEFFQNRYEFDEKKFGKDFK